MNARERGTAPVSPVDPGASLQAHTSEAGNNGVKGCAAELLRTRDSLLSRLKNFSDQGSWTDFFETYCPLIYNAARKRALSQYECEEVVQNTMVAVFRHIAEFKRDPNRGSFRTWLFHLTHSKIVDQVRRRRTNDLQLDDLNVPPVQPELEREWEGEWRLRIAEEAFRRVSQSANPRTLQVFATVTIQGREPRDAAKLLGMSLPRIYLANFRIKRRIQAEVKKLEATDF
jgi:RNA polymerase sigma factor (sigma-70 family)